MTATSTLRQTRRVRATPIEEPAADSPSGLGWVLAAEGAAGALGFVALVYQARTLGPESFARVEYAGAVAAWMLVLVRGGVDVIAYREAARRPRLVATLTDLLIGLRCVAAVVGYLVVLAIAALVGPGRGGAVAVAGLSLFASAWVADVGPRATGRLGWVALAQAVKAIGFVGAVLFVVRGPGDAVRASACLVAAEVVGAAVAMVVHGREHGLPRLGWRRKASLTLARRGAVVGLSRFGRVTLYGADLLALGWWAGADLGPYAAARRLVFALAALGLVLPAALGPWLAQGWAHGAVEARERIGAALTWVWSLGLPASLGLGLTADRWMPLLFGESYRDGGPLLALIAARLPWLLAAGVAQAALVACRREDLSLRLIVGQSVFAAMLVPVLVVADGPRGVGWASLVVEVVGAVAGWWMLARLGAVHGWAQLTGRAVVGCLGLLAACRVFGGAALPVVVVAGIVGYGLAWRAAARLVAFPACDAGPAR